MYPVDLYGNIGLRCSATKIAHFIAGFYILVDLASIRLYTSRQVGNDNYVPGPGWQGWIQDFGKGSVVT